MRRKIYLRILAGLGAALALLCPQRTVAQTLQLRATTEKIQLDGLLDESAWQHADVAKDFQMTFPQDSLPARSKTEVRMLYDDRFLYIGAICYDALEGDYIIQSLKRDFSFPVNDAFGVFIDPFNDQSTGWSFAVNPYGSQREGLIESGGQYGVSTSWNGKWFAEVSRMPDRWVVEIAIPFKTIRYNENIDQWRINFARNDLKRNEESTWQPVPRGFNVANLAFTGFLQWERAPKRSKGNYAIIPYAATRGRASYTQSERPSIETTVGLDAKIGLSASLNLDLTLNPDFSQVEVDQQVINLDRFELFFPERRIFFLENSDLFARLGVSSMRPFFSRRIGLGVPILGGARLSGKLDQNWRIGVMSVQTEGDRNTQTQSQNYSVAVVERKVLQRSSVNAFIMNRQAFAGYKADVNDYNRVTGLEFNYRSNNARVLSKTTGHYAMTPQQDAKPYALATTWRYNTTRLLGEANFRYVGGGYITDIGYVPRLYLRDTSGLRIPNGFAWGSGYAAYRFFAKPASPIDYFEPRFITNWYGDTSFNYNEHRITTRFTLRFKRSNYIELELIDESPRVYFPLQFAGTQAYLPVGNYRTQRFNLEYDTGKRKRFYGNLSVGYGGFYNGHRLLLRGEVNYRVQPWGVFGATFTQANLYFPDESSLLTLIGPRFELAFTRNIFLTTFLQYNTQRQNFNINTRFWWRYAPMSDIYLVYTENYGTEYLNIKNRALVLKLNYWLQ